MLPFPLTKANRLKVAQAFRTAPHLDLSLDCVVEGQMGKVSVDDLEEPTVFQMQTGIFLYFAGDPQAPAAQSLLQSLPLEVILMPSAPGWIERATEVYAGRLIGFDRYSFSASELSAPYLAGLLAGLPFAAQITPMDLDFVTRTWGQVFFIDLSDYDSAQDFIARSAGFYLAEGDRVLAAAYGSLACSRGLEVSLFVDEPMRRRGVATALSCRLLLWCLERGLEPHWDAANPESCKLAIKLGYKPAGSYLAYYLPGEGSPG